MPAPQTTAALANVEAIAGERTLVIGAPDAGLPRALADRTDLTVFHHDLRAHRACAGYGSGVFGAWLSPPTPLSPAAPLSPAEQYDRLIVFLPKEHERLRLLLAMARTLLSEKGTLALVGHNDEGIRSAARPLRELIGEPEVLDYRHHCRIWIAKPSSATARAWTLADFRTSFEVEDTTVVSYPGVFAHGRLDEGTAMLLRALNGPAGAPDLPEGARTPDGPHPARTPDRSAGARDLPAGARTLDVGCGAGILAARLARSGAEVDAVDADALALHASRETLGERAHVFASDVYSDVAGTYARIVSNPPFHAGVRTTGAVADRLIGEAPKHLEPGGELWIVANRFLDYLPRLRESFHAVHVQQETNRFRVYRARKR